MDIKVLNKNFEYVGIIDSAESFLWVDRYNLFGEFELYSSFSEELLDLLKEDYYLKIDQSEKTMIIESVRIKTDIELGNKLIVGGRSLESILDRRIVRHQTQFDTNVQSCILELIDRAFINPERSNGYQDPLDPDKRTLSRLITYTNPDPNLSGLTIAQQFFGDNIYEAIRDICIENQIGFRILLNTSNQFVFSLYLGEDKSYSQTTNPFVVFSPNFDNLLNSNYLRTKRYFKSTAFVFSFLYDDGQLHIHTVHSPGTDWEDPTGMDQREVFLDLRDSIPRYVSGTSTLIDTEVYNAQVVSKVKQILATEHNIWSQFDGEADTTTSFKYGVDFFLGDIVQIEDEFGNAGRSRITEVMIAEEQSGFRITPTFEPV